MLVGILALAYFSGLIIFYGTTLPVVYKALWNKKKYASFPVLGVVVGVCFCVLGFFWNTSSFFRYTVIPVVTIGVIGWTPLVTFAALLLAKDPVLVKIRNAAAISAGSALCIGVSLFMRSQAGLTWFGGMI